MDEAIREIEKNDGVRLTWNVWGTKGEEAAKVPLACLYNIHQETGLLECEPIFCSSCKSVLNFYCSIDFGRQSWSCVICNTSNGLPSHARDITPDNLLPELSEDNSTIEYVLSKDAVFPPVFFFVVDICTFDDERHDLLKKALETTFERIPEDCLVGFIRYGTNIELLELNSCKPEKVYLFSGKTEYQNKVVSNLDFSGKGASALVGRFLMRKYECNLKNLIENLKRDPFPVLNAYKPIRCTGSALSLAVSLMESNFANSAVKYLLFTQGPCTFGPGTVTSVKYKEKGKNDFVDEDGSAYEASAQKFYSQLGSRMCDLGHSVDILSITIEDIGINHMERLTRITGGMLIMAQDFDGNIYNSSCEKLMSSGEDGILTQGFNAKVVVKTSKNLKYNGVLGMGKSGPQGWKLGAIFPSTNITLLLSQTPEAVHQDFGYVQIITQYQRSDRKLVVRVTTFARMFSDIKEEVVNGFDQEAVAVFQARFLLMKKYEEVKDCERMIDKNLIRFAKAFGKYSKGHPGSLVLPESMAYYPNFMFFFKRSLLVQTENVSIDESVYFKNLLYREKVDDALKLIKPTLISYNYETGVSAVELDSKSLQPDVILVLDTFHNVVIWKGSYVSLWIKEGYHEQEEYSSLKEIIEQSKALADDLCKRVPTPQFCITEENKSQQRILHHYVNPSASGTVITENISFDKFFDALSKVVVSSED
ncbi:Protein transport protein SEC23 [Nosema granulosis]|uniref:Protein transport protein SEC23 n=1 Tax=Nosema granulosis TaxID=83296 RepID=A0A9P6KY04_9MICR|nr:Protein transport protein SEC23 [Nosema granulosis]